MTELSEAAGPQALSEPSYELGFDLDGTSFAVRENLADILERELLGPVRGPEEVLPFSPRSQCLVGHIAPVKLTDTAITAGEDEAASGRGHLVEARTDGDALHEVRGVPALAAEDNEVDAEDDDREDRAPKHGLMIPASMGLRFQI